MSNNDSLSFDVEAQLAQIEEFTNKQQQEMQAVIDQSQQKLVEVDVDEVVEKVKQEVTDLFSELESKLDEEISKINQQLETLLPSNQS